MEHNAFANLITPSLAVDAGRASATLNLSCDICLKWRFKNGWQFPWGNINMEYKRLAHGLCLKRDVVYHKRILTAHGTLMVSVFEV